ncbi:MAG TPA: M48 family metallopeptidase [Thermoanaerobaculia bacterium]|nr:M48 family metallopeptidase [Thermoanaerobaculia bacterium]
MTNLYDQQRRNLRRSAGLLAGFVVFLAVLGIGADMFLYGAGVSPGIPVMTLGAILFGAGSAWWSLREGDRAVLESTRARPVNLNDPRERVLDNVVEEMAIASGLPKPSVWIVPDPDPNAFATGSGPEKSSIAVTEGLLAALDRQELQGVVSHEMSHVRNYDIRVMTVVAALVGSVLLISDWGRRGMSWGGGRRDDRDGGSSGFGAVFFVVWILSLILAPIIAQIVAMSVSREREYLADASGAELTRNPLGLASALEKIDAAAAPTESIKQGVAHLCIADPRGRSLNEKEGAFSNLFATHPPISKRIALLKEMAYQVAPR